MRIFYFYLVYLTVSISYSVLPFHLLMFSSFAFFDVLSKCSRKAFVYTYIKSTYNMHFRKLMNFYLAKTFMIFDSSCLTWYEKKVRFLIKKIDMQQTTKITL